MDGNFSYYNFSASILKWYISERRDLPWRNTTDPYNIWLSEIILQQTRVNQGLPYYLKFLEEYPTVYKLAEADLSTVLRTWQGLGYYSRARNLHKCAITICEEYGGEFPSEYDELIKLPGIGSYTASAIASFAFKKNEAVVDGNVFRVLSRYFGIEEDISSSKGQKYFHEFALKILPEKQTDQYNQGLMEFGALQCKPASPACDVCPIAIGCFARERNFIEKFPVKTGKTKIKKVVFNYVILLLNQKIYMQKREVGIWQGLYEFFLVEGQPVLIDTEISKSFPQFKELTIEKSSSEYIHQLSHRTIHASFYFVYLSDNYKQHYPESFYSLDEIENLPKPVLIEKFFKGNLIEGK